MSEKVKLTPENVLLAYTNGYFPMADEEKPEEIYWHRPEMRAVFLLEQFELRKSLRKILQANQFEFRINGAFEEVIKACSKRNSTWISDEIIRVYSDLNRKGFAYSFEAWKNNKLVGGLYGLVLGKAFFGESMFHTVPNASKATFAFLVTELIDKGFIVLDSQYLNEFTYWLGAREISDEQYMQVLDEALMAVRNP